MKQHSEKPEIYLVARILLLAAAYFAGGKLGLSMPYMDSNIILFWPPSGIALAALLMWRLSCWPGIFLGALAINLTVGDLALPVALGISLGNTVGPVLGASLLTRAMGFQNDFIHGRDSIVFFLAGPGSMLLTASIGVFALYTGGKLSADLIPQVWLTWWFCDTAGILVFTPLILFCWAYEVNAVPRFPQIKWEFILALGICISLSWLIFGDILGIGQLRLSLAFLVFPTLIWIGLCFNALGTFTAVLSIVLIAVIGTAKGLGPFSRGDPQLDQLILSIFVATTALIAFMMIGIQASRRIAGAELSLALEELQAAEKQQRELRILSEREQSRMSALLSAMSMGILFEDNERRVEYVNPAFLRMWGMSGHENLFNMPTKTLLERTVECFAQPILASKYMLNVSDIHKISERFELELNDARILTQLSYPVIDIESQVIGRLWIYEDITQQRQTAQQLLYLAERDPLTGLYNRHRFQEELNNLIATSLRSHHKFSLLYFDLDDFKYINDTFGHKAGDTVLVRTAGEISSIIRHNEVFARLGGDEFAILSLIQPADDIGILPARIVTSIAAIPLHFSGTNIRLTTSVGVAIFPEHGETAEDLVAHADTAMYEAKNQGKNSWAIYDPMHNSFEAMMHRMTWHNRILQALEQDLFEIHFQGVYETEHDTLTHLEILVRMRDFNEPGKLIMPGQFIPIAEKNGQIVDIDRWVIKRSIELLNQNPFMPPVAINISGRTFDDQSIPNYIRSLLNDLNVDPMRLIVELTETAAVSDIHDAQRFIEAVHQVGCRVCLDDFGSGFSTFAYLKYLGVEFIKIDGLFIRDLPNNRDNQLFVKAMVEVARGLGKITVAEFVEDAATLEMVKNLGIDLAQGYYLGRPGAEIPS